MPTKTFAPQTTFSAAHHAQPQIIATGEGGQSIPQLTAAGTPLIEIKQSTAEPETRRALPEGNEDRVDDLLYSSPRLGTAVDLLGSIKPPDRTNIIQPAFPESGVDVEAFISSHFTAPFWRGVAERLLDDDVED